MIKYLVEDVPSKDAKEVTPVRFAHIGLFNYIFINQSLSNTKTILMNQYLNNSI